MDLSTLSDADLMKLYQGTEQPAASPSQGMSDADLMKAKEQTYSGKLLPFSRDANGMRFDSNAGLLGSFKRAFTLPQEVYSGQIDPKSDEGMARAAEMATVVSPVSPALAAGGKAIPGIAQELKGMPSVPSTQMLRETGAAQFGKMREMGVDYKAAPISDMANKLKSDLYKEGVRENLAPDSFAVIEGLANPAPGAFATLADLHSARQTLQNSAQNFNRPKEQAVASEAIRRLDEFIAQSDPQTVLAGPAAEAAGVFKDALGNYAASARAKSLDKVGTKAERSASRANSGANLDNAIRQRVTGLLDSDKQLSGFSEAERTALDGIVRGTTGGNVVRRAGNILGGGGGIGSIMSGAAGAGAGSMISGDPLVTALLAAAVPAAGMAVKGAGNAMTKRALGAVNEQVRMRSPLYEALLRDAKLSPVNAGGRDALVRALMLSQQPEDRR